MINSYLYWLIMGGIFLLVSISIALIAANNDFFANAETPKIIIVKISDSINTNEVVRLG